LRELTLVAVDAYDDVAQRQWYDLRVAAYAVDRPGDPGLGGFDHHQGYLRHPWPGKTNHVTVALAGDRPVGWFGVWLRTEENLDTAEVDVEVHPAFRRQGHGGALLAEAVRFARAAGRGRLVGEAVSGSPGESFAAAAGARRVLVDTQRRLSVADIDRAELDRLLVDAREHAAGYSLVQWVGAPPAEHLDAVAALESRMTTDAPLDDLVWEQEVFDADRITRREDVKAARGVMSYTTAARHDETGQLVGTTTICVTPGVEQAGDQEETIVLPDHRGHRLGVLLKIENLAHLRRHQPAIEIVDTWNADSNAPDAPGERRDGVPSCPRLGRVGAAAARGSGLVVPRVGLGDGVASPLQPHPLQGISASRAVGAVRPVAAHVEPEPHLLAPGQRRDPPLLRDEVGQPEPPAPLPVPGARGRDGQAERSVCYADLRDVLGHRDRHGDGGPGVAYRVGDQLTGQEHRVVDELGQVPAPQGAAHERARRSHRGQGVPHLRARDTAHLRTPARARG
jgi:GNAT superfamily N-acetyltransferase